MKKIMLLLCLISSQAFADVDGTLTKTNGKWVASRGVIALSDQGNSLIGTLERYVTKPLRMCIAAGSASLRSEYMIHSLCTNTEIQVWFTQDNQTIATADIPDGSQVRIIVDDTKPVPDYIPKRVPKDPASRLHDH